ncbi:MAG: hypothetical protein CMJ18_21220 [Phycisphaeraceae bacterium]|nr:hypothetical protein [Phycisphaeraceae bacterium]
MAQSTQTVQAHRSLEDVLDERGRLPQDEAVAITLALLESIHALHASGRTHRKIEVATITVDEALRPQLPTAAPWVRFDGTRHPTDACPSQLHGAPTLSVPDRIDAARRVLTDAGILLDPRQIDFHQLGAVLCRTASGHSVSAYLRSPRAMSDLPASLRPIIDRALGLNAGNRMASCEDFAEALRASNGARQQDRSRSAGLPDTVFVEPRSASISRPPEAPRHDRTIARPAAGPDDSTPARSSDPTTEQLPAHRLGHYRIIERIGRGGMGDVYRGYEQDLNRPVAIKVLPPELNRHGELLKRFRAEAAAIARLVHPNVVQIYFAGEDRGQHYFAMQYVDGETLGELLARRGKLTLQEALPIVEQCLAGLGAAHEMGLIHRDVKPGNILLDRRTRRALVADFGLVKTTGAQTQITVTGMVMGTADYIAPEQARGRDVNHRADLYAVGVMAYQMLAGRLPFHADSATAMLFQHAYEAPPPLDLLVPELPEGLVQIVMKLLAKEPDERYQSANEVVDDLRLFSRRAITTAEARGLLIAAPGYEDSPPLQAALAALSRRDWRSRLRARVAGCLELFRARTPHLLAHWQHTRQQMDGAVAEYERRRDELMALHQEAEHLVDDLRRQAGRHAESASNAVDTVESVAITQEASDQERSDAQHAAELSQLAAEQQDHAEDIRFRLGKVEATLVQLRARRNALHARLNAAEAQLQRASNRRKARSWVKPVAFAAAATVGALLLTIVFRTAPVRTQPLSTTATESTGFARIDLLRSVQPGEMAVAGQWMFRGTELIADDSPAARIILPYRPPREYDFIVEYTLSKTSGCVAQLASREGVPFTWSMNAGRPARCRLEDIDGHSVIGNPTLRRLPFEAGKRYRSVVRVRDAGVTCLINSEVIAEFKTDYGDLSRNSKWKMPDPDLLGLGAWNGPVTFHRVDVLPLSGKGEPVAVHASEPVTPDVVRRGAMIGRTSVHGKDIGLVFRYETGKTFAHSTVQEQVFKHGGEMRGARIELMGMLRVPRDMTVRAWMAGGSSSGGVHRLFVDRREVGSVGDDRQKNLVFRLPLSRGDYAVRWVLTGGDFGSSLLTFLDPTTGQPLDVVITQELLTSARSMPVNAEIDNSVDQTFWGMPDGDSPTE